MSIKLIARDLYRSQKTVERLERDLEGAVPDLKDCLEDALRLARAERDLLRRILDGQMSR